MGRYKAERTLSEETKAKISRTLKQKHNEISESRKIFWSKMSKEERSEYCRPFYTAGLNANNNLKVSSIEYTVRDILTIRFEEWAIKRDAEKLTLNLLKLLKFLKRG